VNLRQSIEALIRDYDGDEPTPEGFRDLMRDLRNTLVDCRDNEPRPGGGSRYTAPMASVSPASLAENELDRREALHREEDLAEVLMRVHDHLHLTPQAPADELLDCIAAVLDRQKDSLEHATEAMLKSANINQQRASEVGFDECGDCGEPPKHCHCEHRPSEARSSDVHHTCPYGSPGFFPNCNACVIEMQRGVSKSMHMGWSACTNEAQIEAVTVPREGSRTLAVNGGLVSLEWSGDASMKTIAEAGQKLVDSLKPCTDKPLLDDFERAWRWMLSVSGGCTQQDIIDLMNEIRRECSETALPPVISAVITAAERLAEEIWSDNRTDEEQEELCRAVQAMRAAETGSEGT
jgi:hypothetical protein